MREGSGRAGHGSDEHNCAEFCPTSHGFRVNERPTLWVNYTTAGTLRGCADRVGCLASKSHLRAAIFWFMTFTYLSRKRYLDQLLHGHVTSSLSVTLP